MRLWDRPGRWSNVAVLLVLALSLALRLALIAGRHAPPFSDMVGYEERALLLLREHTFQTGGAFGATYHGPGYIVFLAAVFGLAGPWPGAAYLVQSVLGVAVLWGIYLLGARLFAGRVGLIALVLAAVYVPFFAYANVLLPETLFLCVLVFCVYAVVRGVQDASPWWLLVGGLLCGCAALTRSVALLLPGAFAVWVVLVPRSPPRATRPLALRRVRLGLLAFVGGMVLMLTPWIVRNYADQHMFVPGDTVGGLNLLIGNREGADGTFSEGAVWSNPTVQAALADGKREAALDGVFRDQALAWIGAHPVDFLVLSGRRGLFFLGGSRDWIIDSMGSDALNAVSEAARYYTWALIALALVAGVAGLFRHRVTLLPLVLLGYFLAVVMVFYYQTRYRLPAMPFIILLSAYGVSAIGERGRRSTVLAASSLLAFLVLSGLALHFESG